MQPTPIKKFEKIISEINHNETMVVTKITDFQNRSIVYEVRDSRQKYQFKTLKAARDHISSQASSIA
jgi:hypothetical protein